jgi:hypothetical protein
MKKLLIALAVAAVAAAAYVAAAPGSRAAGPIATQVAALKRQVATLSRKVSHVRKDLARDEATIATMATTLGDDHAYIFNCLHYVSGVSAYGDDVNHTYGFTYTQFVDTHYRAALDFDSTGAPAVWIQDVSASCVTPSGARRTGGFAPRPQMPGPAPTH